MGLCWGGLITGGIFASEIWRLIYGRACFLEGEGLIIGILRQLMSQTGLTEVSQLEFGP